ncbi:hypothetical protein [Frondihabitans australicus]|uniref:Uncharacterized protein n=1 Tax=Frondihabitans australicus TaxID=386892 RepID=A0A495IC86_9MICO|nr:hypothetical protein [Frondihabitans australicus]RKR73532.1 hypothetical protein C8E83_0625 [Frondihabitans australicus]
MYYAPERPPLRFVTPPEWPQPSPAWVARNQGWQPPVGWLPPVDHPGVSLRPASPEWQFWVQDPIAWPAFRAPYAKPAHRAMLWGAIFFVVGIVVTLMGYLGELGGTFLILWGAIIFGGFRLVRGIVAYRSVDATARAGLGAAVRQTRAELDQSAYAAYLDQTARDRAATGRPAMSLDEFGIARDAEPWTFEAPGYSSWSTQAPAGPVPVDSPWASGSTPAAAPAWSQASVPLASAAPTQRPSRRVMWIAMGFAVVLVAGIVIPIAIAHGGSASASSGDASGSSVDGNYYVADHDWKIDNADSCGDAGDRCFVLKFTPEKTCSDLDLTWGFSSTSTGDEKAHRSTKLSVVAGHTQIVRIPDDAGIDKLDYVGLDAANCG